MENQIDALIATLRDEDEHVASMASQALRDIGMPAVEPLIAVLNDKNLIFVRRVVMLLGMIGDSRAVEPLVTLLDDEDSWVARWSAYALGWIGDARAVEPLLNQLEKGRKYAAEALGSIGDIRAIEPLIAAFDGVDEDSDPRELVRGLSWFQDERVIRPLITALHSDHPKICGPAHDGLVRIGAPAVEPLIASFQDEGGYFIENVISVLQEIKDRKAVEPLIDLLARSDSDLVRVNAAYALGELGDKRALDSLIRSLEDVDDGVRSSVAHALGRIGDKSALEPLARKLQDESNHVRFRAAEALAVIGDERAIPTLIALQNSTEYWILHGIQEALKKLGHQA